MNKKLCLLLASVGIIVILLDTGTAANALAEGVELCLYTVFPSLFSLSLLSGYLCGNRKGGKGTSIGRLLGLPPGGSDIWLLSFLGGYPVGVQCIALGYEQGRFSQKECSFMLSFCANPGLSFLFGICGTLFPSPVYSLVLLGNSVAASLLTGLLLRQKITVSGTQVPTASLSFSQCLERTIRNQVGICSWILAFRVMLAYIGKLPFLTAETMIPLQGFLELTGGVLGLSQCPEPIRFVLCAVFLNWGGLCVYSQSKTVANSAGMSLHGYLPGKLLQTLLSGAMALEIMGFWLPGTVLLAAGLVLGYLRKIYVEKSGKVLYNRKKNGGISHAFPKEDGKTMPILR